MAGWGRLGGGRPRPKGKVIITDRTGGTKSPSFTDPGNPWQLGAAAWPLLNPEAAAANLLTRSGTEPPRPDRSGSGPSAAQRAVAAAQAAAAAEASAAMTRAGNSFRDRAANLDPQVAALRHALEVAFAQNRDVKLSSIGTLVDEQVAMLKSGAAVRARGFLDAGRNAELATSGQAESSIANLVRERQDTMSSMLEQGAGQTDMLRGLVSAARNWRQNVQEGNRAYFDSMQSINAGINDLNLDTQTALGNVVTQGESERERLWQDFYNRRSETFTQLGNVYTQQADLGEQAKEMKVGSGGGDKKALAGTAFMDAAKESGLSYKKQGLPGWVKDFKQQDEIKAQVTNTDLASAPRFVRPERAQGALRKWAA